jgi:hypothetical protein
VLRLLRKAKGAQESNPMIGVQRHRKRADGPLPTAVAETSTGEQEENNG